MRIKFSIGLGLALFLGIVSCSTLKPIKNPSSEPVSMGIPVAKPDSIQEVTVRNLAFSGKMRMMLQQEESTEKGSALFWSNDSAMVLKLRNQLGIEGIHLLVEKDSVLEYNRIDEFAVRLSRTVWENQIGLGMLSFTLSQLLVAETLFDFTGQWYDTGELWSLSDSTKKVTGFWSKSDHKLTRLVVKNGEKKDIYLEFDGQQQKAGYQLPKRITIFTQNPVQKISLQLTEIREYTSVEPLTLSIPESVPIKNVQN